MSLAGKLAEERRGRLAAERLLELKQAELFAANRKLGLHARALSEEIVETRAEVASVRDENQRVKSDLTAAHQKIELVERRLWHSIETINDGFAFFNGDLELIMANRSYLAVFDGLEAIRPGVNYITILQMLTDEGIINHGDMPPGAWRQMMTERIQRTDQDPEPVTIQLWNGEYIKVIDRRGPDGDIVSLGLNITAAVRYEAELKEARKIAESANRAKSAFLANMSHEIRTPMNGVVGMADVLAETPLTEEQQLYVDTIKNSGEALLVIINDVLDYSKIEADKLQLHPEPFDLERAIHEVIMLLQPSARDKGLVLALDYDLFLASDFIGDRGRLRQVLTNLLGNAVKFTSQGHVLVRVTGKPDATGRKVALRVTIEDTGIGIPEDMVEHIFGEFNQVENERNRKFDGTGLGLAISQRLIQLMGGDIWVTSQEGIGSCFGFDIELEASQGLEIAHPDLPDGMRHAMVIDDFAPNREILQRQLEQLGLKVTSAGDAAGALALLDRSVDVVLADHVMPEVNGLQFAERARAAGHDMPIMLLSSNPGHAERDPLRSKVGQLVHRPFARQELFRRLEEVQIVPRRPAGEEAEEKADIPMVSFSHRRKAAAPKAPNRAPATSEPAALPFELSPPPTEHASAPGSPAPEPEPEPPAAAAPPRRMRVLAAEDNKTNQLVFRKMVKDLDIDLTFAANGIEAVDAYSSFEPDLIFMDISMPKMDGKEATKAIRAIEAGTGAHVAIVALTAHALEGDDNAILASGLDHYLTKPLRKPEILAQISRNCPEGALPPIPEELAQAAG